MTTPAAPAQTPVNNNPRPTPSPDLGSQPPDAIVFSSPSVNAIAPALVPLPVISLDSLTLTANPDSAFVIGGSTLSPGGPALAVSGNTISLPTAAGVVVVNGATRSLSPSPTPPTADAMRVLTVGGQMLTADAGGSYKVSGQVLTPGGTIVVAGTTYGLAPSGSALFVDGTIFAQAAPTTKPALVLNGQSYAAMTSDSATGYVLGPGTTLLPGGPAITVSGTVLSLPTAGTAAPHVLINGVTSSFAVDSASPTAPPVLTMGTRTYTPVVSGSTTYYSIAPGVTLTPGGVVTIDGTRVSLGPEGTVAVVGTSTATLVPASSTASTTGSGLGGYVASGLGYTGPAATGGAGRYAECPTAWLESYVMGMIGWCLWFV